MTLNETPKRVLVLLIGEVLEDPRVLKTCRSLRDAGAEVTVACTDPSGRPPRETREELRIVRFPHRRESFLKRAFLWLQGRMRPSLGLALSRVHEEASSSPLRSAIRNVALTLNHRSFSRQNLRINRRMVRAFLGERFDLAHANDADTLAAGCALKRQGVAAKLLYDSHEYWPGIGVHGSAVNAAIRKSEGVGIREADYVVTVNPLIAELLERDYRLPARPSVVMNCPYREAGEREPIPPHRPVRVLYQGKVQAFRGIEHLIQAFHLLRDAELTIAGDGPLLDRVRSFAKSEGLLDRVRCTGRYEPAETLSIVREHDIGVLPSGPATKNIIYSSPNKLFDYAMGGLAIASVDLPFIRMVVEEHRMGVLFPNNTPECIAESLQTLIDDPVRLEEYRRNARKAALDRYSWEMQFAANYPWRE